MEPRSSTPDSDNNPPYDNTSPLEDPENFCKIFWNNTSDLYDYSKKVVGFTREYMDLVYMQIRYLETYCENLRGLKQRFTNLFGKYSGKSHNNINMLVTKVKNYSEMVKTHYFLAG